MSKPLEFYFDFASPYGYFTAQGIDALAAEHGRTVLWRPILLGAVFKITGVKPNIQQPLRGPYFLRDIARCARLHGIPFCQPDSMPMSGVAASRVFYWLEDQAGDRDAAVAFARAVFHGHFVEGRDLSPRDAVADLAARCQGLDRQAVLAAIEAPAVKERLRQETDQAIARGVFGSPFLIVDDEPFWGFDRLDQVARWLATGGW